MRRDAVIEAGLAGGLGGVFGFAATGWVGLGWLGAGVGAANGLVGGWRGIYDWARPRGWFGFVADSTWGLVGSALALVFGALNLTRSDRDYVAEFSHRRGFHVFAGGIGLRRDFALALGNVVANAGGAVGLRGESTRVVNRRRFVVEHEGLHVLQSRLLGPLYQPLYGLWLIGAGSVGLLVAVRSKGDRLAIIETFAYYNNPFEYWAYRNNHYWPPKGAVKRFAWKPRGKV